MPRHEACLLPQSIQVITGSLSKNRLDIFIAQFSQLIIHNRPSKRRYIIYVADSLPVNEPRNWALYISGHELWIKEHGICLKRVRKPMDTSVMLIGLGSRTGDPLNASIFIKN